MNHQLINLLPTALAEASGGHEEPGYMGLLFYVVLVLLILGIVIGIVRSGLKERVFKNPLTQAAEQMYLFIEAMCVNIIGERGRKYIPFIGTLWLMIFVGNTVSLFFAFAPTADLGFNLAMALIAIAYVQFEGIKGHADHAMHHGKKPLEAWIYGFFKHLRHFAGPKLPLVMTILLTPLLFIVELVSEMMKNVSLPLRLYGNMHGGHAAVEALNAVGKFHILGYTIYFPLGGALLVVKLLTVVVQALVFTLLTCVYISLVTHHEEESGHQPAHAH